MLWFSPSGVGAEHLAIAGVHRQGQHAGQVLDDRPAHRNLAARGLRAGGALPSRAQQHHGGGGMAGETENQPVQMTSQSAGKPPAEHGRGADLGNGAGMAIVLTGIRSFSEKCRPAPNMTASHRFRPLVGQFLVGDKPGVKGPARMPATR